MFFKPKNKSCLECAHIIELGETATTVDSITKKVTYGIPIYICRYSQRAALDNFKPCELWAKIERDIG